MGTAYFDPDSVIKRLNQTICIFRGEPVYVETPPRDIRRDNFHLVNIRQFPVFEHVTQVVDYRNPDFDYRAFPLGYMNYGNSRQAHYLSRIPGRQQQQGLSSRILRSSPQASGGNYFFSREMSDCILGNYPSEKQAIENVISYRWNSVAFSRDLAVSCDTGRIFLHFKGRLIGMQDGDKYLLFNTRESAALKKTIGDKVCLL